MNTGTCGRFLLTSIVFFHLSNNYFSDIDYRIVIETLKEVEGTRKCFRMIGGVLVERTVADVLPELESNRERLPKAIIALQEQLTKKGQEINDYIETHDIRVQRSDRPPEAAAEEPAAKSNVLVASA